MGLVRYHSGQSQISEQISHHRPSESRFERSIIIRENAERHGKTVATSNRLPKAWLCAGNLTSRASLFQCSCCSLLA